MDFFQLTGEPKWLNNLQLIEIILNQSSGYNQASHSSAQLAEAIIHYLELRARDLPHEHEEEGLLSQGITPLQIEYLKVNQEFFRRVLYPAKHVITKASELHTLMMHHGEREEENLYLLTLNAAQELVGKHFISRGSLTRTEMHPRQIFRAALQDNAAMMILMHNHPSGNVEPSKSDISVTKRLSIAGELMGIPLWDHIIFTTKEYYSFRERGKMPSLAKNKDKDYSQ